MHARAFPPFVVGHSGCRMVGVVLALALAWCSQAHAQEAIEEFPILYPSLQHTPSPCHAVNGSTHEITYDPQGGRTLWITGQNYDAVVQVAVDGQMTFYALPADSGPHGIEFDALGQLWLTLEFLGQIVRLDGQGTIVAAYDVRLDCRTCPEPINTHPHGLGIGSDGATVWFTGKGTGTVGKITPDGQLQTYALPTVGSVPIYIKAGPDGNMWVTELVGNTIARVTPEGAVTEFAIPTFNSRPIAIVPEPDGAAMWFTEEAGNKVARIDMAGTITEFAVPKSQANVILGGLAFDTQKNLWVQQYVDLNNPAPGGPDHVLKIDKAILTATPEDMASVPVTFYQVPTADTVMHRIIQGPDGNMWFTELHTNQVGKLRLGVTARE
jgi:virginiamycin B lyase